MATIFSQTFMCCQCRLLAPVRLSYPTEDGPLCLYCIPLVADGTRCQQQRSAESWVDNVFAGDSDGDPLSPKKEQLTPAQRRATNRRKRGATARGSPRASYSQDVNALMRLAGVY
jgi:hypothetical protein